MTPLERAARALHLIYTAEKEAQGAHDMPSWDTMGDDGRFYFTHRARAVLRAIREPSDEMILAAWGEHKGDPDNTGCSDNPIPDVAWERMIDAALEEG